jgi:hypothetical protein
LSKFIALNLKVPDSIITQQKIKLNTIITMKDAIKQGIIGAIMGFIMSFAMNYFLIPFPHSILGNALGNGMSGFLSGFMGGFIGLLAYLNHEKKQKLKTGKQTTNE